MTTPESPGSSPPAERASDDRLDSLKEIAAYLRRDVTTVQRWEKRESMPVHRHVHQKMGSVYAFKTDLDAWARSRGSALVAEPDVEPVAVAPHEGREPASGSGVRRAPQARSASTRAVRSSRLVPSRTSSVCAWSRRSLSRRTKAA